MQNALHIHDGGAMNAHEPPWVEFLRQFVERGAIKEFLSSDVQVDIHASGLYPVDIYNADETGGSAGFDHQPIPTALRQRRDGSHRVPASGHRETQGPDDDPESSLRLPRRRLLPGRCLSADPFATGRQAAGAPELRHLLPARKPVQVEQSWLVPLE